MAERSRDELHRLRSETQRQRTILIDTDIDVAMSFLRLAVTELSMSYRIRADDLLTKARVAYAATAEYSLGDTDGEEWLRLRDKHQALADAIQELERKLRQYDQAVDSTDDDAR